MRSEGGGCGCRVDRKRRPGFVRREKRRDRAQAMCRALESWSDGWISRCSVSRRTAGASTAVCGSLRFLRPGSRRPFANTSKRKSHRASAPPFLLGLVGVKIRARSSWKCPRWHARGRSLPSFPTLSWSLPPELAFCPKRRPAFRPLNSFRRGLYYPELSCSAVFGASRCRHLVRILVPGGLGPGPPFRIASGSHPRSARSSQRRLSIIGPRPSLYGSPWSCFVPHEIIALEKGKSLRNTFSTTHHEEVKHKNEGQRQENTNAGGADKRETATREAVIAPVIAFLSQNNSSHTLGISPDTHALSSTGPRQGSDVGSLRVVAPAEFTRAVVKPRVSIRGPPPSRSMTGCGRHPSRRRKRPMGGPCAIFLRGRTPMSLLFFGTGNQKILSLPRRFFIFLCESPNYNADYSS